MRPYHLYEGLNKLVYCLSFQSEKKEDVSCVILNQLPTLNLLTTTSLGNTFQFSLPLLAFSQQPHDLCWQATAQLLRPFLPLSRGEAVVVDKLFLGTLEGVHPPFLHIVAGFKSL